MANIERLRASLYAETEATLRAAILNPADVEARLDHLDARLDALLGTPDADVILMFMHPKVVNDDRFPAALPDDWATLRELVTAIYADHYPVPAT